MAKGQGIKEEGGRRWSDMAVRECMEGRGATAEKGQERKERVMVARVEKKREDRRRIKGAKEKGGETKSWGKGREGGMAGGEGKGGRIE